VDRLSFLPAAESSQSQPAARNSQPFAANLLLAPPKAPIEAVTPVKARKKKPEVSMTSGS
jgi:hypothetical protein